MAVPRKLRAVFAVVIREPIRDGEGAAMSDETAFLAAVLATATWSRLENLALGGNRIGDGGVAALAASRCLTRLAGLSLSQAGIGDAGAEALAASTRLGKLGRLLLSNNQIGDA